jgi:hypothetical protein
VEIDVTGAGFTQDGPYCFVVESDAGSALELVSREGIGLPPALVLDALASTTTTSTVSTSTSASTSSTTTTIAAPPPLRPTAVLEAARTVAPGRRRSPVLRVRARPKSYVVLRFRVTGLGDRRPTSAVVRLRVRSAGRAGARGGRIHLLDRCDWNADQLTWANRPTFQAATLSIGRPVRRGQLLDFDVRAALREGAGDGLYCFAIDTTSRGVVTYESAGDDRPALVVTAAP